MTCVAVINGEKISEENLKHYSIKNTIISEIMEAVNKRINSDSAVCAPPNI